MTGPAEPPTGAPFPWFGGKRRVAPEVWARFGDVPNFVEPFCGSLAVLLGRPSEHRRRIETANDLDGFIANFWRAVTANPEQVAIYANWPVSEVDANARHAWLVARRADLAAMLEGDPDYFDARIAGWWVWGVCAWIGSGYCSGRGPWSVVDGRLVRDAGQGINRKLPHLGNAGQGINRQLPHLGNAGQGILEWFTALADRLRRVRFTSGDWSRVVTRSVTTRHGMTAVFLDPPYGGDIKQTRVYAEDDVLVSKSVREWCVEHGNDPLLRIALCGYAGEGHEDLEAAGWSTHAWTASGGYGGGRGGDGEANRHRERIWFSPNCLPETVDALL